MCRRPALKEPAPCLEAQGGQRLTETLSARHIPIRPRKGLSVPYLSIPSPPTSLHLPLLLRPSTAACSSSHPHTTS